MSLETINPATGERLKTWPADSPEQVSRILDAACEAFEPWSRLGFDERAAFFRRAARVLRDSAPRWARLMAEEMGKPVAQGKAEAEKCAWVCEFYADKARQFLSPLSIPTDAAESYVAFRPLGVILAVMPWNFPFWQAIRAAAPALMAGNAMVLKHASNVCGCSVALGEIFDMAGFPRGVFGSLLVESGQVERVVTDPRIHAVTLTGSPAAGRAVARATGGVLKKCVLELGGSDPYVVLEDADLELAARTCAASRLINSGQSCIAAKRFIVVEEVRRRFEELFIAEMSGRTPGDPLVESTTVGPLARHDLRETVERQVAESIRRGARCLLGGKAPTGRGFYYPPTILTDVHRGMPAFDEEVFGPVAAVVPVSSQSEAIEAANDCAFGLGAAVFTRDLQKGKRIAEEEIQAGSCFVNAFVRSDPRLPFGGIKDSGYGRELSELGIRELVNIKTVSIG